MKITRTYRKKIGGYIYSKSVQKSNSQRSKTQKKGKTKTSSKRKTPKNKSK